MFNWIYNIYIFRYIIENKFKISENILLSLCIKKNLSLKGYINLEFKYQNSTLKIFTMILY